MRWCALTVATLGILPFTPPFSTCDLGMLVDRTLHRDVPERDSSRGPSIADALFFLAQVGEDKEQLKNLAWAPFPRPVAATIVAADSSSRYVSSTRALFGLVSSPVLRI